MLFLAGKETRLRLLPSRIGVSKDAKTKHEFHQKGTERGIAAVEVSTRS